MTYYNVWRFTYNEWHSNKKPEPLSYRVARLTLHNLRAGSITDAWVREILSDDISPGNIVGYNIWCATENRWTRYGVDGDDRGQDKNNPCIVSYQQALKVLPNIDKDMLPEIKEIGADLSPQPLHIPPDLTTPQIKAAPTPANPMQPTLSSVPPFDWLVYNGFKSVPRLSSGMKYIEIRDPYTGLPIKQKEEK